MSSLSTSLLAQTIDDHIAWMSAWLRIASCDVADRATQIDSLTVPESFALWRQEIVKTLQDKPALEKLVTLYDQLQRTSRLIIMKLAEGGELSAHDYDSVAIKYLEFIFALRRLECALAAADSGLDSLTGMRSRTGMRDDLARELSRFQRNGKPFCLALLDIDHFKKVNDTYGHENGDKVLVAVANHLSRNLRPFDDVWRWGGEEFLVCLKEADTIAGAKALERVRANLEKAPIKLTDGTVINATASFGLICATKDATINDMLSQADKALYRAKAGGRNRVEVGTI